MRRLVMVPDGWPCPLTECPPGPFVWMAEPSVGAMGWMSEYGRNDGGRDCFNTAGEFIDWDQWKDSQVQPLATKWEEVDE